MHAMQVKMKFRKEKLPVKPQRPENDPVVELALKVIYRIAKVNVAAVDVVGDIALKQRGQILLKGCDRSFNPHLPDCSASSIPLAG